MSFNNSNLSQLLSIALGSEELFYFLLTSALVLLVSFVYSRVLECLLRPGRKIWLDMADAGCDPATIES